MKVSAAVKTMTFGCASSTVADAWHTRGKCSADTDLIPEVCHETR